MYMQTKVTANKEKESSKSTGLANKNLHNKAHNNRPNIRTTSHKKMSEIFLNDPNSVSKDEFLLYQSAIGF